MDFKKLIIGFVYYSKPKKYVVISATFQEETQVEAVKMSKAFFVDAFNNKTLKIIGNNYTIHTKIKDVKVSSSISNYKNIDFLTDLKEIGEIKMNDLIEIE
jgi:hypothetical protein